MHIHARQSRVRLATCVALPIALGLTSNAMALVTNPSLLGKPSGPQCNMICFKSAQFYLTYLKSPPSSPVLIGRENRGQPINTTNLSDIKLALQGGPSPVAQLNKEFVAAQLNFIGATGQLSLANTDQALANLSSCYELSFIPVTLSTGFVLAPDSTIGDVFQQAKSAIQQNRTTDMVQIATILHHVNGDDPEGRCGGNSSLAFLGSNCIAGDQGVIRTTDQNVKVTIVQSDASYTNSLFLASPVRRAIGTNKDVGKTIDLGRFPPGQELIFEIDVKETGNAWYSGNAVQGNPNMYHNKDYETHAIVECVQPSVAKIRFEDLYGLGDRDFNDLELLVEFGSPTVLPPADLMVSFSYDWIGTMPTSQVVRFKGSLITPTDPNGKGDMSFDVLTPAEIPFRNPATQSTTIHNLKQGSWTVTGINQGLTPSVTCTTKVPGMLSENVSSAVGAWQCLSN